MFTFPFPQARHIEKKPTNVYGNSIDFSLFEIKNPKVEGRAVMYWLWSRATHPASQPDALPSEQEAAQPVAQPDQTSAASLRALCCVSIFQAFRFIFGSGIFLKRFSHRAVP